MAFFSSKASDDQKREFERMVQGHHIFESNGNIYVRGDSAKDLLRTLKVEMIPSLDMKPGTSQVGRKSLAAVFGEELVNQKLPQIQIG